MTEATRRAASSADGPWEQVVEQWRRSPLLRMGVLVIVAVAGAQGYWMWGDHLVTLQETTTSERATMQQRASQLRDVQWERLGPELRNRIGSVEAGLWPGNDPALVQAGLQDWLRDKAKAGNVVVRELSVTRQVPLGPGASPAGAFGGPTIDLPEPAVAAPRRTGTAVDVEALEREGLAVWQVRIKIEFERASALTFLAGLASHPQWLMINNLHLELQRTPPLLSLELRALSRVAPRKP